MDFVKIQFTPDRIKYLLFNNIKKCVFENNGIIFGGFVRDTIISDHYKTIYNNTNPDGYDIHKFWNKLYKPETAARTLVAEDMDICMYTEEDVSNFLIAIRDIFHTNGGHANVSSSDITVTRDSPSSYLDIPIKMHKKINYKITIGHIPYVHTGIELSFDFDIIIPCNNIEPPFYRVDFLSNVFIMNKQGVVMSNYTGTIIDKMSILNKNKISTIIMNDIIEFKTQFCMKNYGDDDNYTCGNFNYNRKVFERINKMLFRHFKWNIESLPFMICNYSKNYNCNNNCCICLSPFKSGDKIVKIYIDNSTNTGKICSNMSISHDKCMFKYFETQIESSKLDEIAGTDKFEFKCPSRNIINFKSYSCNINTIISVKMNNSDL
jgi:hypothetical protein